MKDAAPDNLRSPFRLDIPALFLESERADVWRKVPANPEGRWEGRSESRWLLDCTVGSATELLRPLLYPPPLLGWLSYSLLAASKKGFRGLEKHVVQDQMFRSSEVAVPSFHSAL